MLDDTINKKWKLDFFKIFATQQNNSKELENADTLKIKNFPPVIGQYFNEKLDEKQIKNICDGKLTLSKAKTSSDYNISLIKIDYEKVIKNQLNSLMQQQIAKLNQEDPNFLKDDEKEIIENSDFPFIKLMTLVYSKDTDEMSTEDQNQWKEYMNQFITQQIVFNVINTYFTMKLYQDNIYTTTFQTPYNNEYIWSKYANNQKGICAVYDFKEITKDSAEKLKKLYPIIYSKTQLSSKDIDYDIYNTHCASMIKIDEEPNQYDNEWEFITNHKYTETEYRMLDGLLEPVYAKTMNYPKIKEILSNNYLEILDSSLNYGYKQLIEDVSNVLESRDFLNLIGDEFKKVLDITENSIEIDFKKPEAIYLGLNFPDEKIEIYKNIIEDNNIRIFKIKEQDGTLFKALI